MDIEAHLKTAHKITCRLYEINFESGQVLIVLEHIFRQFEQVFDEHNNLRERTIGRLVKEGQMEESRGKVLLTFIIKLMINIVLETIYLIKLMHSLQSYS